MKSPESTPQAEKKEPSFVPKARINLSTPSAETMLYAESEAVRLKYLDFLSGSNKMECDTLVELERIRTSYKKFFLAVMAGATGIGIGILASSFFDLKIDGKIGGNGVSIEPTQKSEVAKK